MVAERYVWSVAALTQFVIPPTPDATVRSQRHAMVQSRSNCDNPNCRQARDPNRRVTIRGRRVPQLAYLIQSPSPNGAIGFQRDAVRVSASHGGNRPQPADRRWKMMVVSRPVAQLTCIIPSPGQDAA